MGSTVAVAAPIGTWERVGAGETSENPRAHGRYYIQSTHAPCNNADASGIFRGVVCVEHRSKGQLSPPNRRTASTSNNGRTENSETEAA